MSTESTILIVDDIPQNVALLLQMLQKEGYKTLVAESGRRALSQLDHVLPDIILLDVEMPGINGFDTCRQIKNNPKTTHIPVLFLTVLDDAGSKTSGFDVGGSDYITKPFEAAEVLARVKTHLTLSHLTRQLRRHSTWLEEEIQARTAVLHETNNALKTEANRRKQQEQEKNVLLTLVQQQSKQLHELTNWLTQNNHSQSMGEGAGLVEDGMETLETLSEREMQVLRLLADGLSSAEIAVRLSLSDATIRTYRSRIMQKLDIHHVPGLVKVALRHGLTTLEE